MGAVRGGIKVKLKGVPSRSGISVAPLVVIAIFPFRAKTRIRSRFAPALFSLSLSLFLYRSSKKKEADGRQRKKEGRNTVLWTAGGSRSNCKQSRGEEAERVERKDITTTRKFALKAPRTSKHHSTFPSLSPFGQFESLNKIQPLLEFLRYLTNSLCNRSFK